MREDWVEVKLGQACFTTSGGTPSRKVKEYYTGSIPWVKSGELNYNLILETEEYISDSAVNNSSAKIFPKGTLLVALYGATIGKLAILGIEATTNQAVCGIYKNDLFETKFLFNFLFHRRQKLIEQGAGGAQPNISQTILKKLLLPIAPLPEQRAIVAKIEQLFSELDNGIANLKTAKDKLEIYRQAVLKKAFEGDEASTSVVLFQIMEKIQIGPFGSQLHKIDYIDGGVPLINPMHIQNGKICPNNSYSISMKKRDSLPNYILRKGDVIMGRRGEMGRCGLVTNNADGWFCGTGSLYFRPKADEILSIFLYYYLQSAIVKEFLTGKAAGTTMTNLNKKIVSNIPLNLPLITKQAQIVKEIETRLSVCDNAIKNIDEALKKSEALRQSILKKAFEGKLLSDAELQACRKEPDWEPAEKLLERIKKEKK